MYASQGQITRPNGTLNVTREQSSFRKKGSPSIRNEEPYCAAISVSSRLKYPRETNQITHYKKLSGIKVLALYWQSTPDSN